MGWDGAHNTLSDEGDGFGTNPRSVSPVDPEKNTQGNQRTAASESEDAAETASLIQEPPNQVETEEIPFDRNQVLPKASGPLANFLPFDPAALDLAVQQVVHQIDDLGEELTGFLEGMGLSTWLIAAATVAAAYEIARRQMQGSQLHHALPGEGPGPGSVWLPDATGSSPGRGAMSADLCREVLEKLGNGDTAAAEQAFLAYEPYLRMVVRRQLSPRLRAKFDSVDIVQSVWADLLEGLRGANWRFQDAAHLRAFLAKATRNRFLNHVRQYKTALARERSLAATDSWELPPAHQPKPSEIVQAEELWQQLLALCPPAHRELLQLKHQGLPLAEIAARTGLHESRVRRILYDLARRLARRQETDGPSSRTDA